MLRDTTNQDDEPGAMSMNETVNHIAHQLNAGAAHITIDRATAIRLHEFLADVVERAIDIEKSREPNKPGRLQ